MKTFLLAILMLLCFGARAQITLEYTFDSASTCPSQGLGAQLMLIKFEESGDKYIRINYDNMSICVYNMNHTLEKRVSFADLPCGIHGNILYLSENLFNTDSKMEFMYSGSAGGGGVYTGIYNEDGEMLFSEPGAPLIKTNTPLQQYPVYNTDNGTKMILSYPSGEAKVFNLPGTLNAGISKYNNELINQYKISAAYPNPAPGYTKIEYNLPEGTGHGEIVLYDLSGKEIKRFSIDSNSNTLEITGNEIPAGTYYYNLQVNFGSSECRKLIIIK